MTATPIPAVTARLAASSRPATCGCSWAKKTAAKPSCQPVQELIDPKQDDHEFRFSLEGKERYCRQQEDQRDNGEDEPQRMELSAVDCPDRVGQPAELANREALETGNRRRLRKSPRRPSRRSTGQSPPDQRP